MERPGLLLDWPIESSGCGSSVSGWSVVQEQRPDLTLRFVNDAHLNHAMAYLTACSIYSAIFEKSPEGLSLNEITDIRFFENDPKNKDKDRDGNPITKVFRKGSIGPAANCLGIISRV